MAVKEIKLREDAISEILVADTDNMHCLVTFWMPQTASETVSRSCNEQPAQFTTERQPVLQPAVAFLKTSFKHKSI